MPRTHTSLLSSLTSLFDKNFLQRTITALVMGGFVLWLLITESPFLIYVIILLCGGVLYEWVMMLVKSPQKPKKSFLWLSLGTAYMLLGLLGFYTFYMHAPLLGLGVLVIIWTSDIGAYIAGRLLGGPKLAPSISPGKTWSGSIGGLVCSSLAALVMIVGLYGGINWWLFALFVGVNILAQIGDLMESKVKRLLNLKDSGSLLPGHGGLIDRLDSLFLVGCALFVLYMFMTF